MTFEEAIKTENADKLAEAAYINYWVIRGTPEERLQLKPYSELTGEEIDAWRTSALSVIERYLEPV